MREFKFRAWINKLSCWADSVMVHSEGGYIAYKNDIQYVNCEIMQYIGLKDKNGKEIWEGDIIEIENYSEKIGGTYKYKATVDFYIAHFRILPIGREKSYPEFFVWNEAIEVIGNIHENPDLLKET